MDRTTSLGYGLNTAGKRVFVDQNLLAGIDGTDFLAVDATGHQEEIMAAIEAAGLAPDPANLAQLLQAISIIGRRPALFVPPGTSTWVCPAGVSRVKVRLWGGGGGGGACTGANSAGAGGGGGGYSEGWFAVTPGVSYSVTVGAGGAAGGYSGSVPTVGGGGGTSSFGGLISATGGGGGGAAQGGIQASVYGTYGQGYGGQLSLPGIAGAYAYTTSSGFMACGIGGGCFGINNTGPQVAGAPVTGFPGNFPGGGGAGGAIGSGSGGAAGGFGAAGLVILEY